MKTPIAKNEVNKSILKGLIMVFFSLMVAGLLVSTSHGEAKGKMGWGISFAGGVPQQSKYNLTM
jgi:hypothetical protein